MQRPIIEIDEDKCDGCGDCVKACHEGAIAMVHGKAKLVSDTYCDGLGVCLGHCPQNAIRVLQREADAFDEAAVKVHLARLNAPTHDHHAEGGCPDAREQAVAPRRLAQVGPGTSPHGPNPVAQLATIDQAPTELSHWPIQLRLLHPAAPALRDADLLVCADCVPFVVGDFHQRYLRDHAVVVACPKLDDSDDMYARLQAIVQHSRLRSITVLRMEVPCCGGIAHAAIEAAKLRPELPVSVHVITREGEIFVQP